MLDATHDKLALYTEELDAFLGIDKANRPMEISAHTQVCRGENKNTYKGVFPENEKRSLDASLHCVRSMLFSPWESRFF